MTRIQGLNADFAVIDCPQPHPNKSRRRGVGEEETSSPPVPVKKSHKKWWSYVAAYISLHPAENPCFTSG